MDTIKGINHIGIRIRDLTASRAFYEKIGFQFIVGPVGPEPVAVMKHPGGVNLNFIINADADRLGNILMDDPAKHPGYTHIALDVADLDAVQIRLQELEIEVTDGPIPLPNGGAMLFVRDPDRNVLEFHMSPKQEA